MGELPWKKVYDYILETEGYITLTDFYRKAMTGMQALLPFDAACVVQCNLEGTRIEAMDTTEIDPDNKNAYLEYYHQYDCFKRQMAESEQIANVNWLEFIHNRFYTDFIKPQQIRHSLGVALRDQISRHTTALVLHRSTWTGFSEKELEMASLIQPHLTYLFTLFNRTTSYSSEMYFMTEITSDCKLLSKRESEITMLMLQRMTFPEIAARLGISTRTVEYHVTNIYEKFKVKNRKELLIKINACQS